MCRLVLDGESCWRQQKLFESNAHSDLPSLACAAPLSLTLLSDKGYELIEDCLCMIISNRDMFSCVILIVEGNCQA